MTSSQRKTNRDTDNPNPKIRKILETSRRFNEASFLFWIFATRLDVIKHLSTLGKYCLNQKLSRPLSHSLGILTIWNGLFKFWFIKRYMLQSNFLLMSLVKPCPFFTPKERKETSPNGLEAVSRHVPLLESMSSLTLVRTSILPWNNMI